MAGREGSHQHRFREQVFRKVDTSMLTLMTVIRKRPEVFTEDFRHFMEHEYGPIYAALPWSSRDASRSGGAGDQVLGQVPQAPRARRVDGVAGDAVQGAGAAVDDFGLVAVDEVAAADAFEQR